MIPPIPVVNTKIFEIFVPVAGKLLSPLLLIFMLFIWYEQLSAVMIALKGQSYIWAICIFG